MTRDPGLQPQRTALAWVRTALGAAGTGGLLLKAGVNTGSPITVGAAILALVDGAVLGLLARRRRSTLAAASRSSAHVAAERELTLVALLVLTTGMVALVAVLADDGG